MKGRKIRKLSMLSNICKVLGAVSFIGWVLMVLNVDGVELACLLPYLLKMLGLFIACAGCGVAAMELDARREELIDGGFMRNV